MSHLAAKRFTIESPDYKHGRWCGRGVEITNAPATTGLMAAAVDSYFYVAGLIPKGTPMRILPLANNFHKYYQFDQDDFSYRTMKKLVGMKPDMILDEHCERELAKGGTKERLLHPEAILQGEKTLGTLRLALTPGYPGLEAEHAVHLTTEAERLFPALFRSMPRFIQHCYILIVVMAGWVLFRSQNIDAAYEYFRALLFLNSSTVPNASVWLAAHGYALPLCILLGTLFAVPAIPKIQALMIRLIAQASPVFGNITYIIYDTLLFSLLGVSLMVVFGSTYLSSIYFRF